MFIVLSTPRASLPYLLIGQGRSKNEDQKTRGSFNKNLTCSSLSTQLLIMATSRIAASLLLRTSRSCTSHTARQFRRVLPNHSPYSLNPAITHFKAYSTTKPSKIYTFADVSLPNPKYIYIPAKLSIRSSGSLKRHPKTAS